MLSGKIYFKIYGTEIKYLVLLKVRLPLSSHFLCCAFLFQFVGPCNLVFLWSFISDRLGSNNVSGNSIPTMLLLAAAHGGDSSKSIGN
jgi:hypothetical protein